MGHTTSTKDLGRLLGGGASEQEVEKMLTQVFYALEELSGKTLPPDYPCALLAATGQSPQNIRQTT
jgi:hypothetical protein